MGIASLLKYHPSMDEKVATVMIKGIFFSDGPISDDDLSNENDEFLDIGMDTEEEIKSAFFTLRSKSVEKGLDSSGATRLSEFMKKYWDILRLRLVPDPAADVEPMKIQVKDNAQSIIAKAVMYEIPPEEWELLDKFVTKLAEYGLVVPNTNASWAGAPYG